MPFSPESALVWGEIPVTDLTAAMKFYEAVFGYELTIDEMGPNPVSMLPYKDNGTAGHLYPGKPAGDGTGPTLHLLVAGKLEDAMERCRAAGGQVISDPVEIPPGRFAYALDLDGNSLGLFEPAG